LDDSLENPGVRPFSKNVEIRQLIRSFLDVYKEHPLYQKPSRLLSGTTSVHLESLGDALENLEVKILSRKVEM
jgi:hypothetical protein